MPVQIILTNCDAATEEQINTIKSKFANRCVNNVCSVNVRTRKGFKKQFGKEKVLKYFIENSFEYVGENMIHEIHGKLEEVIEELFVKIKKAIKKESAFFDLNKSVERINKCLYDFGNDERVEILIRYNEFLGSFNIDYEEKNL